MSGQVWTYEQIRSFVNDNWDNGGTRWGVLENGTRKILEMWQADRDDMQATAAERERTILRMFEDLTPGGSEFHNSPQRVASWLGGTLKSRQEKIFALARERNQAQRDLDEANARIAELEGIFLGLKEMPLYVEIELEDGETETPVSIVGVHPLRWRSLYPECAPTHGFYRYEWPDDESEADDE